MSTGRRGVTGGVLTYGCCCIKTFSTHQQLVSLSSMESELHALQHVAQEMSALQKVIGRILYTFQEVKVKEVPGVLYSDSESALKLLRNLDVPRKSRHLEIRIEWIKERLLVISMTRFFIDYCCSRSIVADVFIRIFIDFSYFSACVGCSLWILNPYLHSGERCGVFGLARVATSKGGVKV